jgi:small subunit ribosomal protein S5
MIKVPIVGTTVPHEALGHFGSGKVIVLPAPEGSGVIAGGPVRAVMEVAGIKDVRTKSIGSNNPTNCVRATIDALIQMRTKEEIAALRGKTVAEI